MIIKDGVEQTRPELATHDTDIKADIGDFSGRTNNLKSLLAVLGVPDVDNDTLYKLLYTDMLAHGTHGLSALDTDIGTANTAIAHGTYGLSALQVLIAALQTDLDNGTDGLGALKTLIDANQTDLDAIIADVGDFSARSNNLKSLLAVLGVPDVDDDTLYKLLYTDMLAHGTHGLAALDTDIGTANTAIAHGTYGLSALQVLIAAIQTDLDNGTDGLGALKALLDAIPTTAMRGTDNAALASVVGALDDAAAAGAVTDVDTAMAYIKQLVTAAIAIEGDTGTDGVVLGTKAAAYKKLAGEDQIAATTEDLNQAAGDYDLFTGTTQPVLLTALTIKMPDDVASDATLTSISVQTDDTTPVELISSDDGAVANLTAEAEFSWTGAVRINVGTKVQLTINGGAEGAEYITTITALCKAIADGGYL